jgi:hypothetical protein
MKELILSKKIISLFIILFINFIVSIKYLHRVTDYYLFLSILLCCFYGIVWNLSSIIAQYKHLKLAQTIILLTFLVFSILIFIKITPESLNVDRWSVITSFWDNFFQHKYVYSAKSHMNNYPGPMPFYFILALPFYYIGELGLYSILGLFLFLGLLKYSKLQHHIKVITLILLTTSTFYLWEVLCRSNIFINGVLILFSMVYTFKSIENKSKINSISIGVIIGLLLSTRNVYVIPYIITFLFLLKNASISITKIIQIGIITLITFTLTFIPFIINHFEEFRKMNPFIIQSGYLMPFSYTLFCIALSFLTPFITKNKNDVYFFSGMVLFITILLHFTFKINQYNFDAAFFQSRADISYFILCVPFFLYYSLTIENTTKPLSQDT